MTNPSVETVPLMSQSVTGTAISDVTVDTGTQVDMSLNEETCSDMMTTTLTTGTQVDMSLNEETANSPDVSSTEPMISPFVPSANSTVAPPTKRGRKHGRTSPDLSALRRNVRKIGISWDFIDNVCM